MKAPARVLGMVFAGFSMCGIGACGAVGQPTPQAAPLRQEIDLNRGEAQEVELAGGKKTRIELLEVTEVKDDLCSAVRRADVKLEVDGETVVLTSANYRLPVTVGGVQIDSPITQGYYEKTKQDSWGLVKDARVRLWPAGAPLLEPGTFVYPLKQRWFASDTQMCNEPVFVDGGEVPGAKGIYYHSGLDIGGAEGLIDVLSATDGQVVVAGKEILPGHEIPPPLASYGKYRFGDEVHVVDARGWYYWYVHLKTVDVRPGQKVRSGEKIGLLGKEGGSGGWAHLHFEILSRKPSGKWGTEEGYGYLWEAYRRQYAPKLIAVARPHHLGSVGQKVTLDGTRSWGAGGKIAAYEWTFTDGSGAKGPLVERTYEKPGTYSEVLKVIDPEGRSEVDFAVVQIVDPAEPKALPPTIHAAYAPTFGVRPGDTVTFKVRTFRTREGSETWNFGDGSAPVTVRSEGGYAETPHRFAKPGRYLVRVERAVASGGKAIAHLSVRVGEQQD